MGAAAPTSRADSRRRSGRRVGRRDAGRARFARPDPVTAAFGSRGPAPSRVRSGHRSDGADNRLTSLSTACRSTRALAVDYRPERPSRPRTRVPETLMAVSAAWEASRPGNVGPCCLAARLHMTAAARCARDRDRSGADRPEADPALTERPRGKAVPGESGRSSGQVLASTWIS
jgi:hypothetical protein